jgi:hypothetical protein
MGSSGVRPSRAGGGLPIVRFLRVDPAPATCEEDAREEVATPITGKWCCSCRQWLTVEAFRPNPNNRNGIDSWCRPCHAAATREWRAQNRGYVDEYNAMRRGEYRKAHPLPARPCAFCGEPFAKRADALVCSERCRNERKREQRRQRTKAPA